MLACSQSDSFKETNKYAFSNGAVFLTLIFVDIFYYTAQLYRWSFYITENCIKLHETQDIDLD